MSACNRTSIADVVGAIVGHSMPTVGVVMMSRGNLFLDYTEEANELPRAACCGGSRRAAQLLVASPRAIQSLALVREDRITSGFPWPGPSSAAC
jgi:hypothetical protein